MRLVSKLSLFSTVLGSSLLAVACGGSSFAPVSTSDGNTASDQSALDAPNAGLDATSNVQPAFGDPQIEALAPMDDSLVASVEPSDMTASAAAQAGATAYRVALVWGHLPAPHDDSDQDDEPKLENWTGSIAVDAGAIGLKRTIAFDPNDHIDPRTDPTSLSFTSHTLPYVDGVLVRVVIPAGGTPTLHFKTAALTTDIDLSALAANVGGVQRLADDVEGLSWIGFQEDPGCAKGFVHGRWVKNHAKFGALRGVVSDADGERVGHLRGMWGHAPKRDADVWFAKYVDKDGDAKGLALGSYAKGTFQGMWGVKDETDTDGGRVEGFYSDGYDKADGRGVWFGRWAEKCGK
jgi:hypothetical protein